MFRSFCIVLVLLLFSACVKDKPVAITPDPAPQSQLKKVYVINEGGFGYGNSSISLFDPGTNSVVEDLFKTQNNANLGDVTQSLNYVNGTFYAVVNNSGRIMVCDAQFKKTGQINGLLSPRYFLPITNQKAYVSDFKANAISVIDLGSNTKTKSINCSGWTEGMVLIYNKVFVCNLRRNYVYVINTLNDQINDSVLVGPNASGLVIDKRDKIWVLSSGDAVNSVGARLTRIDPLTNIIEKSFDFSVGESPDHICLNKTKDSLFYLNKGICLMGIGDAALPSATFIPGNARNYYGLGINPNDYSIYASDALDYSQKSNIYIFDMKGNQKQVFKAGINANGFYFE